MEVLRHIEPRSSRIAEVDGGAAAVPPHIHPRDGLEQATPSHRVSTLRQRARPPRGTQRRRRTFPQVVKDLGAIHPSSLIRSVLRVYQRPVNERHLGCGSSCLLFAEGHGRRPCTGRRTRKRSSTRCPFGHPTILAARANGVRGRLRVTTVVAAVLMAGRSPRSGRSVFTYVSKRRRGQRSQRNVQ